MAFRDFFKKTADKTKKKKDELPKIKKSNDAPKLVHPDLPKQEKKKTTPKSVKTQTKTQPVFMGARAKDSPHKSGSAHHENKTQKIARKDTPSIKQNYDKSTGKDSNLLEKWNSKVEEGYQKRQDFVDNRQKKRAKKYAEKATRAAENNDYVKSRKYTEKSIDITNKNEERKENSGEVKNLSTQEANLYMNALRGGNRHFFKATEEGKSLAEKVAKNYQHEVNTTPFAAGVQEGLSLVPLEDFMNGTLGQKVNVEGGKSTGLYSAGEMTGIGLQSALLGGSLANPTAPTRLGRIVTTGLQTAALDLPINLKSAFVAGSDYDKRVEESRITEDEAKDAGFKMREGNKDSMFVDDETGNTNSIENWNKDIQENAKQYHDGEELFWDVDKNGMLHFGTSKQKLEDIIGYYNTADNPVYSLDSARGTYVNKKNSEMGKSLALNTALSGVVGGAFGGLGKGATKVDDVKNLDTVAETVGKYEPKAKPKTKEDVTVEMQNEKPVAKAQEETSSILEAIEEPKGVKTPTENASAPENPNGNWKNGKSKKTNSVGVKAEEKFNTPSDDFNKRIGSQKNGTTIQISSKNGKALSHSDSFTERGRDRVDVFKNSDGTYNVTRYNGGKKTDYKSKLKKEELEEYMKVNVKPNASTLEVRKSSSAIKLPKTGEKVPEDTISSYTEVKDGKLAIHKTEKGTYYSATIDGEQKRVTKKQYNDLMNGHKKSTLPTKEVKASNNTESKVSDLEKKINKAKADDEFDLDGKNKLFVDELQSGKKRYIVEDENGNYTSYPSIEPIKSKYPDAFGNAKARKIARTVEEEELPKKTENPKPIKKTDKNGKPLDFKKQIENAKDGDSIDVDGKYRVEVEANEDGTLGYSVNDGTNFFYANSKEELAEMLPDKFSTSKTDKSKADTMKSALTDSNLPKESVGANLNRKSKGTKKSGEIVKLSDGTTASEETKELLKNGHTRNSEITPKKTYDGYTMETAGNENNWIVRNDKTANDVNRKDLAELEKKLEAAEKSGDEKSAELLKKQIKEKNELIERINKDHSDLYKYHEENVNDGSYVKTTEHLKDWDDTLGNKVDGLTSQSRKDVERDPQGVRDSFMKASSSGKFKVKNISDGYELINHYMKNHMPAEAEDIMVELAAMASEAGKVLNAMKLFSECTTYGKYKALKNQVKRLAESKEYTIKWNGSSTEEQVKRQIIWSEKTDELANAVINAKTEEEQILANNEFAKHIWDQIPPTFKEKADAWRYLSMLGNPKTHIRNIAGNVLFVPFRAMSDAIATVLESTNKGRLKRLASDVAGADETGRTKAFLGFSGNDAGLRGEAKTAWKSHEARLEANSTKYIQRQRAEGSKVFTSKLGAIPETMANLNSWLLDKEDKIFMGFAYRSAYAKFLKANNVKAKDVPKEIAAKADAYAQRRCLEATYRDPNAIAEAINKSRRKLDVKKSDALPKKVGKTAAGLLVDSAVPFVKTPANIVKQAVRYTPANLINGSYGIATAKTSEELVKAIENMSSGMTGTALIAAGYWLGKNGIVNGSLGEYNDKKVQYEKMLGKQNYAVNTADGKSITIDWIAPMSMPFFIGVEISNAIGLEFEDGYTKKDKAFELLGASASILDPLLEMSMMSGIQNVFDTAFSKNPESAIAYNTVENYISQYVPTLSAQISRTVSDDRQISLSTDKTPNSRKFGRTTDKLLNKIPWLNTENGTQDYVDFWGRTDSNAGNKGKAAIDNFANPSYVKKYAPTSVDNKLMEIYETLGEDDGKSIIPSWSTDEYKIKWGDKDINMTEKGFTEYKKIVGQAKFNSLKEYFSTPEFKSTLQKATTGKASTMEEARDTIKKEIDTIYKEAKLLGKETYLKKYEGVTDEEWAKSQIKEYRFMRLPSETYSAVESGKIDATKALEMQKTLDTKKGLGAAGNALLLLENGYSKKEVEAYGISKTSLTDAVNMRKNGMKTKKFEKMKEAESGKTTGDSTLQTLRLLDKKYSKEEISAYGKSDTMIDKAMRIKNSGLTRKDYAKIYKHKEDMDADGNGSIKKDEVKAYINAKYPNMTYQQKLAIMYAINGSKSW